MSAGIIVHPTHRTGSHDQPLRPEAVVARLSAMTYPWWRSGVIYQVYPRSFADSNGDGIGDLEGIRRNLDHLAGGPYALGVDALWLNPMYPSPLADFGYDISDYVDVDPMYGTLDDFDRLVTDAHGRGLRVLLDLVPGHTSDRHDWFVAACRSRDDPHRDFYIWADPAPDGGPPNGWASVFGGSAWEWHEPTSQYYLHSFYVEQPDLNWRHPGVRDAFRDIVRFWRARGVDGFRVDAIDRSVKDDRLRENPPRTPGFGMRLPERIPQHSVWMKDRPEVLDVVRAIRGATDSSGPRDPLLLGEVFLDTEQVGRYLGTGPGDAFDLAFDFEFFFCPWDADHLRASIEAAEAYLPAHGWPCRALSNHDAARHATRLGTVATRSAALLLLTLRSTPVLYQGEEIGMVDVPPPEGVVFDRAGRDAQRSPMHWSADPGGGFTSAAQAWLPHGDLGTNVAAQRDEPGSLLSLYRALLAERRSSPALSGGEYRSLDLPAGSGVLAFVREAAGDRVLVAVELGGRDTNVNIAAIGRGRVPTSGRFRLGTHLDRRRGDAADISRLELRANEGVVLAV
jgi:alpha-glucosidase